jgi:hypothetical protein
MSEEKFEEFLQREAKSYNEPPATVPRDEMFAAIAAARAAGPKTEDRRPKAEGQRSKAYVAWIGMAATLVIGVAIGRYVSMRREAPAPTIQTANNAAPAAAADSADRSYTVAATGELVRAEALLTAYGAAGSHGVMDKQLSAWARDILSNTRLLLDSPAAADPARRKLLQDLELVLVQMVQRSPAEGAREEREQIDRSMERTQVLPRLRSALPATRNN